MFTRTCKAVNPFVIEQKMRPNILLRQGYGAMKKCAMKISPKLSGGNVELVFVPEPQHQQCAKNRNDDPGRMKLRARFGTQKDVRHQPPDNRTDNAEDDRPQKTHVHVHERFRSPPGDQTNDDVPNQMKHDDVSSFEIGIDRRLSGRQAGMTTSIRAAS